MSDKYYGFEYEKLFDEIQQIYPRKGLLNNIDISLLTKENYERLLNVLKSILEHPIMIEGYSKEISKEEVNCLEERTKIILKPLFDNPDLLLYGHGGEAKKIIESEGMYCRYANLGSHFIPLEYTNSSLSDLNNWPHRGCDEIAILALNIHEYNPLYVTRVPQNEYDTDTNMIPIEYFAGYYDSKSKDFIPNPKFKITHEYNQAATDYEDEEKFNISIVNSEVYEIREFMYCIDRIKAIIFFAGRRGLSLEGLKSFIAGLNPMLSHLEDVQNKLTPEFLEYINKKKLEEIKANREPEEKINYGNWDLWHEWNLEDENHKFL